MISLKDISVIQSTKETRDPSGQKRIDRDRQRGRVRHRGLLRRREKYTRPCNQLIAATKQRQRRRQWHGADHAFGESSARKTENDRNDLSALQLDGQSQCF